MRFINMARRSGKTTLLINSAYATGYPIIVYDKARAAVVEHQAKSLGLDIKVFTLNEWLRGHCPCNKVFIDEAADIIEGALMSVLKAEVVACTLTIPMTEINNKEVKQ